MKQITDVRYEIFFREFKSVGDTIESIQDKMKDLDYGKYDIRDLALEKKIALKILEGMEEFQKSINKGIKFDGIFKDGLIEIYNINEEQNIIDESIRNFSI